MKPTDSIPLLSSQSRPTILIVDDDEAIQDLINIYTQEQGFQTRSCPSAETALEDMRKFFCPIVITDVQMPGMGGVELQSHLRAQGDATPLIFITAFPEERIRRQVSAGGAIGFLAKPFDGNAMIDCLDRALGTRDGVPA